MPRTISPRLFQAPISTRVDEPRGDRDNERNKPHLRLHLATTQAGLVDKGTIGVLSELAGAENNYGYVLAMVGPQGEQNTLQDLQPFAKNEVAFNMPIGIQRHIPKRTGKIQLGVKPL